MTQPHEYTAARERAKTKYGFYTHATVYALVMVLLVAIDLLTSPGAIWFTWPLLGWGLAVALHGTQVFLLPDKKRAIDVLTKHELRQSIADKVKRQI